MQSHTDSGYLKNVFMAFRTKAYAEELTMKGSQISGDRPRKNTEGDNIKNVQHSDDYSSFFPVLPQDS